MLGEHGENAVPMQVWLHPLTKLDSRAAKMVREISLALIFDAQDILEELNEMEMQSNDVANSAEKLPEIKKKIQNFKNLLKQHRQTFQRQLARMLPSIRGGEQEEGALVDFLTSIKQSPFNSQRLCEFLDTKEREINHVNSYLTILSEKNGISSKTKLEKIALDPQNLYVVSFIFTSLHKTEPFLLSLQDWLHDHLVQESVNLTRRKTHPWFEDEERSRNARQAAKSIKDFFSVNQSNKNVCFVVASIPDVDNPGTTIYLYEHGELVSKNFELPSKPLPFLISEVRHNSIQLKFQPAEYGRLQSLCKVQDCRRRKLEDHEDRGCWGDVPAERFASKHRVPVPVCCLLQAGRSKSSELSPSIKTLPTSPPEKLNASSVISVAWMSPSIVASGIVVKEYKVEYRMVEAGAGKDQSQEKLRVSAVCDNGALSVPSKELEVSISLEEEHAGNIAHQFLQKSSLVEDRQPLVFALPLKKVPSDASTSCLVHQLGEKNLEVPNKVILVMGATGCGKTTLINGMINYILGVQWENNFRFKLIHETTQKQAGSSI
ncbi:hypothetical protein E2320_014150 [Naja naja]|nr:hypothetical protein E2320_014150 [Naja naja]